MRRRHTRPPTKITELVHDHPIVGRQRDPLRLVLTSIAPTGQWQATDRSITTRRPGIAQMALQLSAAVLVVKATQHYRARSAGIKEHGGGTFVHRGISHQSGVHPSRPSGARNHGLLCQTSGRTCRCCRPSLVILSATRASAGHERGQ
jgi:hypothetical protein